MGACLPHDLAALRTQPPADVSAMDGYAVRAADVAQTPARLRVIGEVAGRPAFERAVGAGRSRPHLHRRVVPQGADTIVIQEIATREGDDVVIAEGAIRRPACARAGLDFAAGETLLGAAIACPPATLRSPPR